MKDFVAYIIKALVDRPAAVQIAELLGRQTVILEIRCHPDDMGRVIGKSGKTISAVRMLVSSLAAKQGCKAMLEVVE